MAYKEVFERDEYGRPIKMVTIFDEQTEKAYRMLPKSEPILVVNENNKYHKNLYYCRDCGSWLKHHQAVCLNCLSRQDWGFTYPK